MAARRDIVELWAPAKHSSRAAHAVVRTNAAFSTLTARVYAVLSVDRKVNDLNVGSG